MAYQDDNQKRQMFDDTSIADSRDQEQVLRGIQPKNQRAYRIYRIFRTLGVFALIFGSMGFGTTFIPNLKAVTSNSIFRWGIILFIGLAILLFLLMFLVKLLFLRKCPFDDWVFEVAQRDLGTDLIFYTSRCLYIKYDIASAKEVDKRDFVTRMSDLSLHYSYFFVGSFPDQQVIQVECTKKQPIPTRAMLEPDDDLYPNIIPIGLTINNYSQRVSPIAWVLNDNNKNPNILETPPSVSFLIAGGTGSGKSVLEQNIVNHVSHFSDEFQLVGVDCKRVEFNLMRGVKGVKGVALDVKTAADTIATFQQQMMRRFKFMEQNQVNNIYKLRGKEVDYYEVFGRKYQFDELFELMVDLDPDDRDYSKMLMAYPEGQRPRIISIEEIYNGLETGEFINPKMPQVKGYNPYIKRGDITKTKGSFNPKILLFLTDEMNELMTSDDYKSVDTIKQAMGSIARLGRAGGTHLALAMQRPSGGTVSSDLMNNIQQTIILGAFDLGASTLLFEKDISNMARPEIKGRGFTQIGKKDIFEVQTYWIEPEKVWEWDEDLWVTYENSEYLKQCEHRGKTPDMSGFVTPVKIGELPAPEEENIKLEHINEEESKEEENWENFDIDVDETIDDILGEINEDDLVDDEDNDDFEDEVIAENLDNHNENNEPIKDNKVISFKKVSSKDEQVEQKTKPLKFKIKK